jgi:hypothetical protein
MTERDIFLAVLDLPDPAARAAYLDAACGGDTARRARVDALIRSHQAAGSFLAEPAVLGQAATRTFDMDSAAESTPGDDEALGFLAPSQRPDSLGRIGQFEVLEVLGRGGFGIVFRAFDEVLQRVVAVKVLAPAMAATSPARKRFLREARSSAQVRHENVVQVYAVEEQPLPYLVMEFIPGETLQQRLDRTGPLDVPEVLRIGRQVAEGLAAAHAQGLIHRDIKPANVMIEGGGHGRVKLTDFGLARAADDASISQSGVVAGTPMYMAPEQAKGESLDHRADLFSLGSVLYVMASGRPPFRASTTLAVLKRVAEEEPRPIREIIPEVPEWLCRVVEKLHAKNPDERFQSAGEVADLLGKYLTEWESHGNVRPSTFARPTPARPAADGARKPVRRRWWKLALVVFILGVTVWRFPHLVLTARNRAEIRLDADDPNAHLALSRNGQPYQTLIGGGTIEVLPGTYEAELRPPLGRTVTELSYLQQTLLTGHYIPRHPRLKELYVGRGDRLKLTASISSATVRLSAPAADGWVPLFNCKDLSGWMPIPAQNWRVENGVIKGTGPDGFLYTEFGEFEDFHLVAEYRINATGDAGVHFRVPPPRPVMGARWGYRVTGLEAEISVRPEAGYRSGALTVKDPSVQVLAKSSIPPHAADEWARLEVVAQKDRIRILVKGEPVTDYTDSERKFRRGHIALCTWESETRKTHVEFRKVDVRSGPQAPPADD